ncbi:uncharacterized protein LOC134205765 [Armigeres subalbatus]|uniref:uncharacterized protein LOC134205765 n=1 Tax=Armigeres subalbatus TaxID=124917 RepID=UPI002ED4AFF9
MAPVDRPRMVLRSRYQPKLIANQHQISLLLQSPKTPTPNVTNESRRYFPADSIINSSVLATMDRTGWNSRVDHALNGIIRGHRGYKPDQSVYGDINRMFDATLCTLVLIASRDHNISEEHLLWSEAFLRGVRDRYGNHPPNVRKLIGYIKHIQGKMAAREDSTMAEKSDLFTRTYRDALPDSVAVTRIKPKIGNVTVQGNDSDLENE